MAASIVTLTSGTPPGTPASGKVRIYSKGDKKLYFKNDAGVEVELTSPQVTSVNGQSGIVVLDAADVGAVDTSSLGNLTASGTAGLSVTGGTGAVVGTVSISQQKATASQSGYLDSADFASFAAGSAAAITSLTGDVTGTGPGAAVTSLATTGIAAGTYTKLTVDAKGRATAGTGLSASDIPSLPANKIPQATTSTDGYLSSTDWNTFNTRHIFEKQLSSNLVLGDNQQIVRGSFSTTFNIQLSGTAELILV